MLILPFLSNCSFLCVCFNFLFLVLENLGSHLKILQMLSLNHSMNLKLQAHNTIRTATYYLPLLNKMLVNSSLSSFTVPFLC